MSTKPVPRCQHPLAVSYTPKAPADGQEVNIAIQETVSDVRTCTSVATYVLNGVRYCDRHYARVTSTNQDEYSEFDDPASLGSD